MSYGWTEDVIFDLPWDRAKVYLDEILIYHEQPVSRRLPQLPEELKLQQLMNEIVVLRRKTMQKSGVRSQESE